MAKNRQVLLHLENVKMHFPLKKQGFFQKERQYVKAVDGITIDIYEGETFGLVGESGCGKSTLGRVILQLYDKTAGSILYSAVNIDRYAPKYTKKTARRIASIPAGLSVDQLFAGHKHALQMAGGLLALEQERAAVSTALLEKYKAVAQQNVVEKKLKNIKTKYEYYKSLGSSAKDKVSTYEEKIKEETKKLNNLYDQTKAKDEVVKALHEKASKKNGFKEMEAYLDHSINLARLNGEEMRVLRSDLQMVFQDPYSSLDPRLTVGQTIEEPLVAHHQVKKGTQQAEDATLGIMDKCGLQPYMLHRYPHQFSGGQRQRIGIARALALQPKFVVCDEAVSALDVSIQSQIINLLMDLKEQQNLTYLFISHDLSAVKFISDRIAVMYLGNVIELGDSETIFESTLHPYTEALLEAIPTTEDEANKELQVIDGDIPSPINPPEGCKFHTRCKYATDKCRTEVPEFREWHKEHFVACHYPLKEKENK